MWQSLYIYIASLYYIGNKIETTISIHSPVYQILAKQLSQIKVCFLIKIIKLLISEGRIMFHPLESMSPW